MGAALTVAGGGDYGDETVDTLRGHVWDRNHEVITSWFMISSVL